MTKNVPRISIVIPAHNEETRIHLALQGIAADVRDQARGDLEVIVVSDGSTDRTVEISRTLMKELELKGEVLELEPCRGKGGALKAGMRAASGRFRFFTDADLATPASTIWKMLPLLEAGAKHVVGSRRHRESRLLQRQGAAREFLGSIFTALSNAALGTRVSDFTCGFKGYTADAAEAIYSRLSIFRWAYDAEAIFIAKRLGIPVAEVPVTWADVEGSKVQTLKAVYQSLFDLAIIRWRGMKGCYD